MSLGECPHEKYCKSVGNGCYLNGCRGCFNKIGQGRISEEDRDRLPKECRRCGKYTRLYCGVWCEKCMRKIVGRVVLQFVFR